MAALPAVIEPSGARFLAGFLALAAVCGLLGFAARRLRRGVLPELHGSTAVLATSVVWLGLLIGLLELLGAVGLFALIPALIGALIIAAASFGVLRGPMHRMGARGRKEHSRARPRAVSPIVAVLALLGATAVLAQWLGPTFSSYDHGIRELDSIWYHLPWAADFARTGWTTHLNFTDVEYLTTFYPASAEMLHGLGIATLRSDFLSPFINLGWLALTLLAAWSLGRPRPGRPYHLGPATMLGAAIVAATPMLRGSQPGTGDNDLMATFFILAAVALLPEDLSVNEGRAPRLMLAAVAAGLALATKLTVVPAVVALTLGVLVLTPAHTRGRLAGRGGHAARWLIPLILAGGYWYVRNWIAIGTPFPWAHIPGLPTPAPPVQNDTAFSVAHYLPSGHFLTTTVPHALDQGLGTAWPALLILLIAGPLACLIPIATRTAPTGQTRPTQTRPSRRTVLIALVALATTAGYILTPQSAPGPKGDPIGFIYNLRYCTPALALTLIVTPLAPVLQSRTARAATLIVEAVLLVLTLARSNQWQSIASRALTGVGIAVGVLVILAVAAMLLSRTARHRTLVLPVLATLLSLVVIIAGADAAEHHYLKGRYRFAPGVSDLAHVWASFRGIDNARVAVSGTYGQFFAYPLFGSTDSDTVQYLAAPGPHGSFTPIRTCRAFIDALNTGRYQYLVDTPNRNVWHPKPLRRSPASSWIRAGGGAREIYAQAATGQRLTVWRLSGRLSPAACPGPEQ
jgi:hypothetical protein